MAAKKSKKKTKKAAGSIVEPAAKKTKRAPVTEKAAEVWEEKKKADAPTGRQPVPKAPALPVVDNPRTLNATIQKVNTQYKRKMLFHADELRTLHHIKRPTGIMALDVDLGGGFAAGTFNTITGPDHSGKSTMLYKICAMHQRLYGDNAHIAFAPVEDGGIDYWRARRMGWHVAFPDGVIEAEQERRHQVGRPLLTGEEIAELRTGIGSNVQIGTGTEEEILDAVEEIIRQNKVGILWLDSLEALEPNAEASLDSLEENPQQGAHARLLTRFFQHYGPIANSQEVLNRVTFIGTCQVRANRKKAEVQSHIAKYLLDYEGTNVRAVRHWRRSDVWLKMTEKLRAKGDSGKQIGKALAWEIKKGKDDTHDGIKGEVDFYYDVHTHTNDFEGIITTGMRYGAIIERNGMLTLLRNGAPDDYFNEVPNQEIFIKEMAADFERELDVRMQILNAAHKGCLYRGE